MPKKKSCLLGVVLFLVLAAMVQAVATVRRFSARDTPSALETHLARATRKLAVLSSARDQRNPFAATAEILAEARAHFADHCAICHANNGSGQTEIGLYTQGPRHAVAPKHKTSATVRSTTPSTTAFG
jgi:mono/diheme cytochrome c family protein